MPSSSNALGSDDPESNALAPDAPSPSNDDDPPDDFEEFGQYGRMAALVHIKGFSKHNIVPKMRQTPDARLSRKLNKPVRKDKPSL